MTLLILPDTNSLLHFKRPDQVDWRAIAGQSIVEIVLTTVVVRELEKHSNHHPVSRIRDRARKMKSWMRTLLGADASAAVRIDAREPTAYLVDGLDPLIADDRLIATAMMFQADRADVALYTDDTLLHAKALGLGLTTLWPSPADRLKDEPDPAATEVERLKKELAGWTTRRPDPSVEWTADGPLKTLYIFAPDLGDTPTPLQERARLQPLAEPPDHAEDRLGSVSSLGRLFREPSRTDIQRYNDQLDAYHLDYGLWYEALRAFATVLGRVARLEITARNTGTSVATSFRAHLALPEGLRLLEDEDAIGECPEPPQEPEMPAIGLRLPNPYGDNSLADSFPLLAPAGGSWDDSPYPDLANNSFELRRAKLLQHNAFAFDGAIVLIGADMDGTAGAIHVSVICEELPHARTSTIAFRVVAMPAD